MKEFAVTMDIHPEKTGVTKKEFNMFWSLSTPEIIYMHAIDE